MALGTAFRSLLGGVRLREIADDFNRANSSSLDMTPTGSALWIPVIGTWGITSNRATTSTAISSHPHAVVESDTADVDVAVDVNSGGGGDALYFRVVDANNWLRLRYEGWQSSSTSCQTCTEYNRTRECNHVSAGDCAGVGGGPSCNYKVQCGSCPPSCPTVCCSQGAGCTHFTWDICNSYSCNCSTNYYNNYRTTFDRMVNGSLTTIGSWNGSSSRLRAVASAGTVRVYTGSGTTDRGIHNVSQHATATRHGLGRANSSYSGSALDNFSLTPLAA